MKKIWISVLFVCVLVLAFSMPCFARGDLKIESLSDALTPSGMSYSFTCPRKQKLLQVMLVGDAALSETLTVSHDSVFGAAYDTTLNVTTLSNEKAYVFRPDGDCAFFTGDKLTITSTFADTGATVYGVVQFEDWN